MNFNDEKKSIMYVVENAKLKKILLNILIKRGNISFIYKKINKIDVSNTSLFFEKKEKIYDMIILCTGRNNKISEKVFGHRAIEENKNDKAFTCILKHNSKINVSRQYFLKEGPLALLPISDSKLSLIWSMNKNYKKYSIKEIQSLISNKINYLFKNKIKFSLSSVNSFPINFKFNKKVFIKNVCGIGESTYNFYPIAGQGFNVVLRDIEVLNNYIEQNISLGLQIKNSSILNDFSQNRKPEDLLYGLGINLAQKFFRYNNLAEPAKRIILKELDKLKYLKKIGLNIVDKGLHL